MTTRVIWKYIKITAAMLINKFWKKKKTQYKILCAHALQAIRPNNEMFVLISIAENRGHNVNGQFMCPKKTFNTHICIISTGFERGNARMGTKTCHHIPVPYSFCVSTLTWWCYDDHAIYRLQNTSVSRWSGTEIRLEAIHVLLFPS
jgi:hypothetical protein